MKYFRFKRQHLRQNLLFGFLAVGLFLALPVLTKAAPGDLDPTFGNGGIVITRGNDMNHLDYASAMAIQSDGKIVVVGDGNLGNLDFTVIRYNTDGSLDTSFGGGIVQTSIGNSHDQAWSVAIQADGKIVVAGGSYTGGVAVVRYNPNGSLDTSFNGTGIVTTSASSDAWDLAIQADGKIVAAAENALIRYNTNGSLDTSFNGTGIVSIQGRGALSVAIQADGKIVATGGSQNSFAISRYNPDGSLDTSFGGTGIVIIPVSGASDLAVQSDGKIVAAGVSHSVPGDWRTGDFAVVRYNPNGTLDTSFGGTGKIIIPIGNSWDRASSAAIQTDDKIVVTGDSAIGDLGRNFVVVRLNPNGSLDTTFNGTGKVTTPFCCQTYASEAAIQADGKIVVAGATDDYAYDFYDPVVVRYEGGSESNIRTRFDFDGDGKADVSVFRPSDRIWYLNQSTNGFSATQFGLSTDKITPADFDGDGKTDIAVYREGTWYWLNSSNGNFNSIQFGLSDDVPLPADFTGDGRAELAVYRGGNWYTLNLSNNQFQAVQFGLLSDKPVVGDYDGDGRADYAVYRDGTWFLLKSTDGFTAVQFGISTDKLVPGDYDGDGKTDQAVFRDGTWYVLQSSQGFTAFQFGVASDAPSPADYDGDGRTDAAVYRDGNWYLRQSASGFAAVQFGIANDKPVPAAYLP